MLQREFWVITLLIWVGWAEGFGPARWILWAVYTTSLLGIACSAFDSEQFRCWYDRSKQFERPGPIDSGVQFVVRFVMLCYLQAGGVLLAFVAIWVFTSGLDRMSLALRKELIEEVLT